MKIELLRSASNPTCCTRFQPRLSLFKSPTDLFGDFCGTKIMPLGVTLLECVASTQASEQGKYFCSLVDWARGSALGIKECCSTRVFLLYSYDSLKTIWTHSTLERVLGSLVGSGNFIGAASGSISRYTVNLLFA